MKKRRGTSIIEVVIATALISVSIIAALSLTNRSQKQNTYAKGLAEATKYTTQAADWIRTQRDTLGWATIASKDDDEYCLIDLPADFTSLVAGPCDDNAYIPNTIFKRKITITKIAETVKIVVTVYWTENVVRQATIEMELTQW